MESKLAEIERIGKTLPVSCHQTVFQFLRERTNQYTAAKEEVMIDLRNLSAETIEELYTFLRTFDENRKKRGLWQNSP
jgi:hypothetical protein